MLLLILVMFKFNDGHHVREGNNNDIKMSGDYSLPWPIIFLFSYIPLGSKGKEILDNGYRKHVKKECIVNVVKLGEKIFWIYRKNPDMLDFSSGSLSL